MKECFISVFKLILVLITHCRATRAGNVSFEFLRRVKAFRAVAEGLVALSYREALPVTVLRGLLDSSVSLDAQVSALRESASMEARAKTKLAGC